MSQGTRKSTRKRTGRIVRPRFSDLMAKRALEKLERDQLRMDSSSDSDSSSSTIVDNNQDAIESSPKKRLVVDISSDSESESDRDLDITIKDLKAKNSKKRTAEAILNGSESDNPELDEEAIKAVTLIEGRLVKNISKNKILIKNLNNYKLRLLNHDQ